MISLSKLMQIREILQTFALTALCLAATPVLAEDSPLVPADAAADRIDSAGVTDIYRCVVGDAATVRFSSTGFDVTEIATVPYAPKLSLALRIERK